MDFVDNPEVPYVPIRDSLSGEFLRRDRVDPVVEPGHSVFPVEGSTPVVVLDRKSVKKNFEGCKKRVDETGSLLYQVYETYRVTGNSGHAKAIEGLLEVLDAFDDLLTELKSVV